MGRREGRVTLGRGMGWGPSYVMLYHPATPQLDLGLGPNGPPLDLTSGGKIWNYRHAPSLDPTSSGKIWNYTHSQPPPPHCGQTHKVKTLPSLTLRVWVVIIKYDLIHILIGSIYSKFILF